MTVPAREFPPSNLQEHHISYDPEITIDILKELHEKYHGHGVGKGRGYTLANRNIHNRLETPSAGLFATNRGVQGHYYFPKQIQEVMGTTILGHSMGIAVVIWNKDEKLEDVITSVEIILQSLKLRKKIDVEE